MTPPNGEGLSCRVLLHHSHCKGENCLIEFRTLECSVYSSFLEACNALEIIDNDKELDSCLEEDQLKCGPSHLRRFVSKIICFSTSSNVPELLIKYADRLEEDVGRDLRRYEIDCDSDIIVQIVVILIGVNLNDMYIDTSAMRQFGLHNLSAKNREETLQALDLLRLSKKVEGSFLESSGNPFTNSVSGATF